MGAGALLSEADEQGNTALHCAAANGHAAVCKRLVDLGADPRDKNAQMISAHDLAMRNGHSQACSACVEPHA
eukprot:6197266-Pleurochrysis_carterae.AAC.1